MQGQTPFGEVNNITSCEFQDDFITRIGGNNNQIKQPIAKVYMINNFQVIALAIPFPGSPQRQLAQFGFDCQDWRSYADCYFSNALSCLNE